MDSEFELKVSDLSRSIEKDGKTVKVEIYGDGAGKWILEIVDEHGNSTVWDDQFSTEQDALNEAISAVEQEGIDCFIGPVSGIEQ
ncbi:hypothetical protein [Biformimicrobium ophioploci]|uniref:Uncharacterized protein n=1 Tax=Biformimicrobium ophioploci TaxID=3036711 RepID=A0ABQ6M337_9GAMM|nr:hypothetical protein [Microbulbifer sp. NKW57]GMG88764.1 hypothetical protein MNKW57_30850 [Microbulbifer sp. NKW57]